MPYGIVNTRKTRSQGKVVCIFCRVFISKEKACIEQHINGVEHKELLATMDGNGVCVTDDKTLFCKVCMKDFGKEETVNSHVTRADHANLMVAVTNLVEGEYIDFHDYLSNDEEEILCKVCNCPFIFSLEAIEQHVNWFNHRSSLAENVKPHNGMFPAKNGKELWCKICDVYIVNNTQSVQKHIHADSVHVRRVQGMEDHTNEDGIDYKEYLSNQHKLTVVCRYCHVDVKCNILKIEKHVMGSLHLTNLPDDPDET